MKTVRGRILGPWGPIAGAIVLVESAPGPTRDIAAITGADGGFQLPGLPIGRCELAVGIGETTPVSVSVEVERGGDTVVEILIPANAAPLIKRLNDESEEKKR